MARRLALNSSVPLVLSLSPHPGFSPLPEITDEVTDKPTDPALPSSPVPPASSADDEASDLFLNPSDTGSEPCTCGGMKAQMASQKRLAGPKGPAPRHPGVHGLIQSGSLAPRAGLFADLFGEQGLTLETGGGAGEGRLPAPAYLPALQHVVSAPSTAPPFRCYRVWIRTRSARPR